MEPVNIYRVWSDDLHVTRPEARVYRNATSAEGAAHRFAEIIWEHDDPNPFEVCVVKEGLEEPDRFRVDVDFEPTFLVREVRK